MSPTDHDQEWRRYLIDEIKELRKDVKLIKDDMLTLKVKVALFSSVIASGATILIKKLLGA